jgi:hypothetical protein
MSLSLQSGTVMDFRWPCPEMLGVRGSKIRRSELLPGVRNVVDGGSKDDGSEGSGGGCGSAAADSGDGVNRGIENVLNEERTLVDKIDVHRRYLQYLPPRSLLLMNGDSRYEWTHGIAPRKMDKVNGVVIPRGRRLSLTLRRVLFDGEVCNCTVPFCVESRKPPNTSCSTSET